MNLLTHNMVQHTFTVHYPLNPDVDESSISSEDAVYAVLGGAQGPFPIKIDKVLGRSTYVPSTAVAKAFSGCHLRCFLAGDAAHQNIPTGGYGMNTGLGDAFDIAWKLAAVVNGYGGRGLLSSYQQERRPVASRNVERAAFHMSAHLTAVELLGSDVAQVNSMSERGVELKNILHKHYRRFDGENTDLGIEMGYRYVSNICMADGVESEPVWDPHCYLPTTWSGSRAPNVYLTTGESIFDRLGPAYSLVEFKYSKCDDDSGSESILESVEKLGVPLAHVVLVGEETAARLWEKKLVLVRPDGHVAWRGSGIKDLAEADLVVKTVVGRHGQ